MNVFAEQVADVQEHMVRIRRLSEELLSKDVNIIKDLNMSRLSSTLSELCR